MLDAGVVKHITDPSSLGEVELEGFLMQPDFWMENSRGHRCNGGNITCGNQILQMEDVWWGDHNSTILDEKNVSNDPHFIFVAWAFLDCQRPIATVRYGPKGLQSFIEKISFQSRRSCKAVLGKKWEQFFAVRHYLRPWIESVWSDPFFGEVINRI